MKVLQIYKFLCNLVFPEEKGVIITGIIKKGQNYSQNYYPRPEDKSTLSQPYDNAFRERVADFLATISLRQLFYYSMWWCVSRTWTCVSPCQP